MRRTPALVNPSKTFGFRRTVLLLALLVLVTGVVFLGSCKQAPSQTPAPSTPAGSGPAASTAVSTFREVDFPSEDGLTLNGRVYGSGSRAVVLSHMYPADQSSWFAAAERLAGEGYLALTFDFRGYGKSGGEKDIAHLDRDVVAAVSFLHSLGATRIALVGASMGGTACLRAAAQLAASGSPRIVGVATLSAPVEFKGLSASDAVPRLDLPLLFLAAEKEPGAGAARELAKLAGDKAELRLFPGEDHGTRLLTGAQGPAVYELLIAFLMKTLGQ